MESQQKKVTIYYDGLCNLCSGAINTIAESTQKERFTVFDVTNGPLPPNVSREEALRNMYAVATDGRLYKGADAVLKILEEYPNSRWISYIGRMPVYGNWRPCCIGLLQEIDIGCSEEKVYHSGIARP